MNQIPNTILPFSQTLSSIIPVIIGGLLAAGGAFGGSILNDRLHKNAKRNSIQRDRLEQAVIYAYNTLHWLDQKKDEELFEGIKLGEANPISKLEMIVKLYFPSLKYEFNKFHAAVLCFRQWSIEGAQLKSQQVIIPKEHIDKFSVHYEILTKAAEEFTEKAAIIMNQLIAP